MQTEDYMIHRVENQISWYGSKSARNKKLYQVSSIGIIIFSAMIPFLTGLETSLTLFGYKFTSTAAAGLLGALTASLTGIAAMMKFQDKWITYRVTCEALEREKILFQTATAPYQAGPKSYHLFISNVERILAQENSGWQGIVSTAAGQADEEAG